MADDANMPDAASGGPVRRKIGLAALLSPLFYPMVEQLDLALEYGAIHARLPDGSVRLVGGRGEGPLATIDLHRWRALLRAAHRGSSGWYEAWAAGEWCSADPVALFDVLMRNRVTLGNATRARGLGRLLQRWLHARRRNSKSGAAHNIKAHYDLGNDFYAAWLDETMSYSAAVFADPTSGDEPLAAAQKRKLATALARTQTAPGEAILEIGCGWGGFVEFAAREGRAVRGITLSAAQRDAALARIMRGGLERASVDLIDYREIAGTYDAVVSIEMVEAVGQKYWPQYLEVIARSLKPGGRAVLQYITIDDAVFADYARNVDFIQRYIFPGGMLLSEQRFRAIAAAQGLAWEAPFTFGNHYAETLRRWRTAFDNAAEEGRLPPNFDQRFINLWRYYLMYCEGGFRSGGINVGQVTLVKQR